MKKSTHRPHRYAVIFSVFFSLAGCTTSVATLQPEQHQDELRPELYIWPNSNRQSSDEVSLRLIVKVGSLQEETNELGHAHFVEHLAFNGTQKFPGPALIARMRELDLEIGQHSNAYTTFDHTSYQIDLNSVDAERLDSAMELLAEWSYNLDFNATEIEQERLIIMEEWRQGETTDSRVNDAFFEDYYGGTLFLDRQPIGTQAGIESATSESLQSFYQRWYQPQNQAVIVAGDIDSETVKAAFERHFPVRPSVGPQPQTHYVNPETMSDFLAVSDDFATQGYIDLSFYSETPMPKTPQDIVEAHAWQAALDIWHQRALKRVEQSGGAVTDVDYQWEIIAPNRLMIQLYANLSRDDFQQALDILEGERLRLLRDGIEPAELDRWRNSFLTDVRRQQDSALSLADAMIDHYLYNFPMIGQSEALERIEQTIPTLTPATVGDALAELMTNSPKLNLIYPMGSPKPETDQMQAWLNDVEIAPSADVESGVPTEEAWSIQPERLGKVLEERILAKGIVEWTLDNGVTVIYRFSDENQQGFRYELFSMGGLNYLNPVDARVTRLALPTLALSGLRDFSAEELSQWLDSVDLEQQPFFNFFGRGMYGGGPVDRFDLSMRLLHIALTEAHVDPDTWTSVREQNLAELEQMVTHPHRSWIDLIEARLLNDDPALVSMTTDQLNQITPLDMQNAYDQYFSGSQNYRLAIVGDLHPDTVREVVLQTIATLPTTVQLYDNQPRPYPGATETGSWKIEGSGEASATVVLRYSRMKQAGDLPHPWSWALLEQWVNEELNDQLREVDGSVYQIQAAVDGTSRYQDRHTLIIQLQTEPNQTDAVVQAVNSLLQDLAVTNPEEKRLASWHRNMQREFQRNIIDPVFQAEQLAMAPLFNLDSELVLSQSEAELPTASQLSAQLKQFVDDNAIRAELIWLP